MAVLGPEFGADPGEARGETAAVVGRHVGEAERESGRGFARESDGADFGLVILGGDVDGARAAFDGDERVAFAPLAPGGLWRGQVFDVDVVRRSPRAETPMKPRS